MPESEISIFGSGTTFYNADTGWTWTEESAHQLTPADADYDTSSNSAKARAFAEVAPGFPIHSKAQAHISETIYPSGSLGDNYRRYAEFTISGNYKGRIAAYGTASSSYNIDVFLFDKSNNSEIEWKTIKSKNAAYAHLPDVDEGSFEAKVSGYIHDYREYRIGVSINTFAANRTAVSPSPFAAGANFHSDIEGMDPINGYVEWDSIELNWIGDAEQV